MTRKRPQDGDDVSAPPAEESIRPQDPSHPDTEAELRERADGAHAETVGEEANLRADDTAPGVDPDEDEDSEDQG